MSTPIQMSSQGLPMPDQNLFKTPNQPANTAAIKGIARKALHPSPRQMASHQNRSPMQAMIPPFEQTPTKPVKRGRNLAASSQPDLSPPKRVKPTRESSQPKGFSTPETKTKKQRDPIDSPSQFSPWKGVDPSPQKSRPMQPYHTVTGILHKSNSRDLRGFGKPDKPGKPIHTICPSPVKREGEVVVHNDKAHRYVSLGSRLLQSGSETPPPPLQISEDRQVTVVAPDKFQVTDTVKNVAWTFGFHRQKGKPGKSVHIVGGDGCQSFTFSPTKVPPNLLPPIRTAYREALKRGENPDPYEFFEGRVRALTPKPIVVTTKETEPADSAAKKPVSTVSSEAKSA